MKILFIEDTLCYKFKPKTLSFSHFPFWYKPKKRRKETISQFHTNTHITKKPGFYINI